MSLCVIKSSVNMSLCVIKSSVDMSLCVIKSSIKTVVPVQSENEFSN